jgi:hypothetical protein
LGILLNVTDDLNYILRAVETKSAIWSLLGRRLASALITILAVGLGVSVSPSARATSLFDTGTTVDVFFYLGDMTPANTEEETMGPTLIGSGLSIPSHELDLTSIDIEATRIVLTDETNLPYCSTGDVPCQDSFTGFEFKFSAGVDITGVSVDPSSSASMSPILGGLTLSSPNDLLVI